MKLYHLYGLALASDFDCPELTEITPDEATARGYETVRLVRATAPLTFPQGRQIASWASVTRDAAFYQFRDYARMLVERPDRVMVEMLPGAAERDMRAYLFGTGFGTLMHMRGLIPLHVSAILTPEGVVAFTGPSGAGKSTKVAELHLRHGWPLLCDDVAVLHPTDDRPLLHSGMNRIKLWKDAVERFDIDPSRLTRDTMRNDKFHLHAPEMFVGEPLPLRILYWIGERANTTGETAHGQSFEILLNAVYRSELVPLFGDRGKLARDCMRFADSLEVRFQAPRPRVHPTVGGE